MNIDKYGLPVQADGDANDQLNRVAILSLSKAQWLFGLSKLRSSPGIYTRYVGGNPNNVSGDQLVPVYASMMTVPSVFNALVWTLIKRVGFSQNTHTIEGTRKFLPDFLLPRVLPFIARAYLPRLLVYPFDIILLIQVLLALIPFKFHDDTIKPVRKSKDDVDQDVNLTATLYSCVTVKPTLLSRLAVLLYDKLRQETFGSMGPPFMSQIEPNHVKGALRWYHRAGAGGNPEVGQAQCEQWDMAIFIAKTGARTKVLY